MEPAVFFSVAGLVFWALSFLYFRSYLKDRTGKDRLLAEFADEIDKMISEIDAATDRDVALVEERIRSLRALLEETDKRIGAYRREIDRRVSEERAYGELGRRRNRPYQDQGGEFRPSSGEVHGAQGVLSLGIGEGPAPEPESGLSVAERGMPVAAPPIGGPQPLYTAAPQAAPLQAAPPISVPPASEEARFVTSEKPIEPKPRSFADRVAELHRAGFSSDLIAKRLGATVAEVDLAVALASRMEGDGSSAYRN